MDSSGKPFQRFVWGALLATIFGICAAFLWSQFTAEKTPDLPVIGPLPNFALTNQDGHPFTRESLLGHVTVADIIFTRCGGPCPEMTRKMSLFQRSVPSDRSIHLLTLTTDPGYDTPEVLKQFGAKFNADFSRWSFVTGPKPEIVRLAVGGLKLIAEEKPAADRASPEDLFIHSILFVVIDKQARLRGAFDSSEPDFDRRVRSAVKKLLKEKPP